MKAVISFVAGAAIGAVTTYFICKDRMKQKVKEDVDASIDAYRKEMGLDKPEETEKDEKIAQVTKSSDHRSSWNPTPIEEYASIVKDTYLNKEESDREDHEVEIISVDEYGEDPSYMKVLLTWYEDGTVADDMYDVVDEDRLKQILGAEDPKDLEPDTYPDDVLYIANHNLRCYYELVKDPRTFEEASSRVQYLHHMEDEE